MQITHSIKKMNSISLLIGLCFAFFSLTSLATNYLSIDDALKIASSSEESVYREPLYLSKAQIFTINERLNKAGIDREFKDEFFVRYSHNKNKKPLAYSYTDTARQRSKPQSVLITLDIKGKLKKITLLRNLEPAKYHPSDKWLNQFKEQSNPDNIKLNSSIVAITGATMTSRATVKSVKRIMVIHGFLSESISALQTADTRTQSKAQQLKQ